MSGAFPVVAVLGPRQSGKTTLVKNAFKNYKYVSLEDLSNREEAELDPKGFLKRLNNEHGIIIDEFQHTPKLLSYIQLEVDENRRRYGYFILTGSQNFLMNRAISQTLAGRVAITTLLPLSINELKYANMLPESIEELAFKGGYPEFYVSKNVEESDSNKPPHIYFLRDKSGREIDCLIEKPNGFIGFEIKAGMTPSVAAFKELNFWKEVAKQDSVNLINSSVIYSGDETEKRAYGTFISWKDFEEIKKIIN